MLPCHDHKYDPWKARLLPLRLLRRSQAMGDVYRLRLHQESDLLPASPTISPSRPGWRSPAPISGPRAEAVRRARPARPRRRRRHGRGRRPRLEEEVAAFVALVGGRLALGVRLPRWRRGYQVDADGALPGLPKSGADLAIHLAPPPGRLVAITPRAAAGAGWACPKQGRGCASIRASLSGRRRQGQGSASPAAMPAKPEVPQRRGARRRVTGSSLRDGQGQAERGGCSSPNWPSPRGMRSRWCC